MKFSSITKTDFEKWNKEPITDDDWSLIEQKYSDDVESFIDYITETLLEDWKNKEGIFTVYEVKYKVVEKGQTSVC